MIKDNWKPIIYNSNKEFPFLVIDNWYNKKEEAAVWKELEFYTSSGRENLSRAENTVIATKNGKPLGKSYRLYLQAMYNTNFQVSNIIRFLEKQRRKEFHDLLFKTMPHAINFVHTNCDTSLLSYYENEDHYDSHTDVFPFTCLIWFHKKPKRYKGGDFYFEQSKQKIESKHNRLIIFPGYYKHGVEKIEMDNKLEIGYGRYTITTFFYTVPNGQ